MDDAWQIVMKGAPDDAADGKNDTGESVKDASSRLDDAGGPPDGAGRDSNEQAGTPAAPAVCSRKLQQLCPACFGGSTFGTPLSE